MRVEWIKGSPAERGTYWIVINGAVELVEIGPAWIRRDDPNAALLIKTLGGMAYDHAKGRSIIDWYAPVVAPPAPCAADKGRERE